MVNLVPSERIKRTILLIRGQKVMLKEKAEVVANCDHLQFEITDCDLKDGRSKG